MVEALARWLGTYAIQVLLVLLVAVLLLIALLWRLFEAYYGQLWSWGNTLWQRLTRLAWAQRLERRYPRLWAFLGRRLSPGGYLGLHLTLGLLLSLVALSLFGGIAEDVLRQEAVVQFDQALAIALHQHATSQSVTVFEIITVLGSGVFVTLLGLGVGVVLFLRRRWLLLTSWGITLVGAALLIFSLKDIFQRARPHFANPFVVASGWSFPSGHATGSLIVYGMLTYLLVLGLNRAWAKVLVAGAVTLILLIGFSRLYLGVHFFSDVIAGYLVGTAWLAITISGTEVARRRQQAQKSGDPS